MPDMKQSFPQAMDSDSANDIKAVFEKVFKKLEDVRVYLFRVV